MSFSRRDARLCPRITERQSLENVEDKVGTKKGSEGACTASRSSAGAGPTITPKALLGDRLTYLPALPDRHPSYRLFSHLIARPRPVLGEATRLCTLILKMLGT